ncbi:flagellar hook-associated protein FlgK [Burkholderia dolosa]|uniref:flagellar hook-associated protein FlgK n=1 Tax=Burkholderia dolosa TaxID=152500 RepID=UPI00159212F6|nr:flagellar hook-associated protein FlgK [Burkholderia dolosa]MBR8460481.1 flagellar hook-associated protein FlgK [Burkholderia dolosa]
MNITQIGLSGALAARAAIDMSARNIANLQTVGYTRQGVLLSSRIGGGVDVSSMIRFGDYYKTQQKWASQGPASQYGAAQSYFRQLEGVMGLEDGSVKLSMNKFFGALDAVSAEVTSPALRQQVLMAASGMATSFNNLQQMMRGQLDTLRQQSAAATEQINGLSRTVADLNLLVAEAEAAGGAPSELIDRRDQAIDQLSALADIRTVRQSDGTVDVSLAGGTPLVTGRQVGKMSVETLADGTFALKLELSGTQYPLDGPKVGGMLGGLSAFAKNTLLPQMEAIRSLAGDIAENFNKQFTAGFGMDGSRGKALFTFNPETGHLTVNEMKPEELGFSGDPKAPGNSDNLLKLIELRTKRIDLPGFGETSLGDAYVQLVGKLGAQSQQNQSNLTMASNVRRQAEEAWQELSGVNKDEEAINVVEAKKVYEANMKVISVAQELFDATIHAF